MSGVAAAALSQAQSNSAALEPLKIKGLDITKTASMSANVFNGGIATNSTTITIPAGSTGNTSYIQAWAKSVPNIANLVGLQVTFVLFFTTTPSFNAKKNISGNVNLYRSGVFQQNKRDAVRITDISPTLVKLELDYTVVAGDTQLIPFAQISTSSNTEAGSYQLTNAYINSSSATALQVLQNQSVNVVQRTIKQDGTGDYTTFAAAFATVTDSSPMKWYEFTVYPPTLDTAGLGHPAYDEINLQLPPYTRLIGTDKNKCWLRGAFAASIDDTTMTQQSTLNVKYEYEIRNLKVTGRNCRYAIHSESSGAITDVNHTIKNCHIEHYGNQDVINYRAANSLPAGSPWTVYTPYGYGSSSGIYAYFENVTFKSPTVGWYVHNNQKFSKPNINKLVRCNIINMDTKEDKNAIAIECLGSGTNDQLILEGCQWNGRIFVDDKPWSPYDLSYQYANHYEMEISGYGNTPAPYFLYTLGQALRFTSNNTTGSSMVRVSGSAMPLLMGEVLTFDGLGGLKGYGYGRFDVSDMLVGLFQDQRISGMFRRLGNCTTTSVTLTVQFEAQAAINIVFNEDYTVKDNTYVLNKINAALGTQGVADLFNPSSWERPKLRDERLTLVNMNANGIPRYSAVKKSTILGGFDIMSYADDINDFLGFLEEDVNPSDVGTIKIKGYFTIYDVLKDGTVNFANGNYIGISTTTAGKIINTTDSTKRIGKGVSAAYFGVKL